jgi:hypothetical protein
VANPKTTNPRLNEIMESVRKSEGAITEARRKLGEKVRELSPGDRQSIRRVVDELFDFTEIILKTQREFTNSVLDTLLGDTTSKRAPAAKRVPAAKRAPAKPAAKRTTRKATRSVAAS